MYMKCCATAAAFVLMLCGCEESKTTLGQTEFKEKKVYVDGTPFTGKVWSDDSVTFCLEAEDGEIVGFTLYHDNSAEALRLYAHGDSLKAYSENGDEISVDSFNTAYKPLATIIPELAERITGKSE